MDTNTISSESILDSIKKLLGLPSEYTAFDTDVIIHINTVFSILNQLNVGPEDGFYIESSESVWSDYLDTLHLNLIKTYVYQRVRILFDPPTTSSLLNALNSSVLELEWRILAVTDF